MGHSGGGLSEREEPGASLLCSNGVFRLKNKLI